jgi:Na+/proline symporter
MMTNFALIDWLIIIGYFAIIGLAGLILSRRQSASAKDYFLASGTVPPWLAAISVIATTQSAATFLGGPDYGYRGDFTYLSTNIGGLIAAYIVARVLMPKFYGNGVSTVYELLSLRFGPGAMRAAGGMFVIGRILAGGARLYLAALAVSMVVFGDVSAFGICASASILVGVAFLFTFHGGLRSIVWIDLVQFIMYIAAALAALICLRLAIPATTPQLIHGLWAPPDGLNKLRLINLSFNTTQPFALPAIIIGFTLLSIGNFGLDQDTTQRLLACRNAEAGARGLYMSVLATLPVVAIFIAIGSLLYVIYQRPDLMGAASTPGARPVHGGDVTVFMRFILTRAPPGVRGLATVGVLATAIGTTMSALNAMSSVLIQDFYRPWLTRKNVRSGAVVRAESHFVFAGRVGMGLTAVATLGVAVLSFYWQRGTNTPLLEFVLSIMNFAYAGLLGVYFTAIFTRRGSTATVIAALAVGFIVILVLQPSLADRFGLPTPLRHLAFPWQLCLGAMASFLTCILSRPTATATATAATEMADPCIMVEKANVY